MRRIHIASMLLAFAWAAVPAAAQDEEERPPLGGPEAHPPPPGPDDEMDGPRPPRGPRPDRFGGPGGRFRGPWDEMGPGAMVPPEKLEELLDFAREHFPGAVTRMERLRETDPQAFRMAMRRMAPRLIHLKETFERDPAIGKLLVEDQKLEEQIRDSSRRYRETRDETVRTAAAAELRELLGRQWEVRMERRRLEIAELEKRLAEQRQRLEERQGRREQMIEEQLNRLIGEAEEW